MSDEHDHGTKPCLRCALREAVQGYAEKVGGEIDAGDILARLAETTAAVITSAPPQLQAKLTTFAHKALSAALIYEVTGVVQDITVGDS